VLAVVCWCWCVVVCWCCGVLVLCAGRLEFLVDQFHTQCSLLYLSLCAGVLTPPRHASGDQLLACLVAWPARLVQADLLGVCHVDKIILLMIIKSVSFKFA
jgi:hypothetical protein